MIALVAGGVDLNYQPLGYECYNEVGQPVLLLCQPFSDVTFTSRDIA